MSMLGSRQLFRSFRKSSPALPYDAEVKWLESTGTQYIDTGLPISQGYRFIANVAFVGRASSIASVGNTLWYAQSGFNIFQCSENAITPATGSQFPTIDTSGNVFYDIDQKLFAGDKSATIDGVVYATSTTSLIISIPNWNYLLFAAVTSESGGGINRYGYLKCRSFSVYNTDNIKLRDFIPVRFTNELGESEGAMYDKVTKRLFRNQGTGKFIVGADKDMPYDYAVEYIETDGVASYIDTGITPVVSTSKVETKFQVVAVGLPSMTDLIGNNIFGAASSESVLHQRMSFVAQPAKGYFRTHYPTLASEPYPLFDYGVHEITYDNSALIFDGTQHNVRSYSNQSIGVMALGTRGAYPSNYRPEDFYTKTRFYYFKMYSGSGLVFDGIPVVANGVACMYDYISKTLKYNAASSGTITAGPPLV